MNKNVMELVKDIICSNCTLWSYDTNVERMAERIAALFDSEIAKLSEENELLKDKVDVLDQALAEESAYSPHELRMEAEIASLRAELAAEREKHRWIPGVEKYPDEYQWCLVIDAEIPREDRTFIGQHDGCGEFYNHCESVGSLRRRITHWRPLPAPPEQEVEA